MNLPKKMAIVGAALALLWSLFLDPAPARAEALVYDGTTLGQPDYDYAPSVIYGDGPEIRMWWCGNRPGSGDGIFYAALTASGWTTPRLVLGPSASGWDSFHVCDPSVVKGTFEDGGSTWSYAMYYTATYDTVGYDSQIGVAFSNDGIHWVKYSGNPVISAAETAVTQYGAGMQTAYRHPRSRARVSLAFFDSTKDALYLASSRDGKKFGKRRLLPSPRSGVATGDIAYHPQERRWYVSTKSNSDREIHLYKTTSGSLLSSWISIGTIDRALTAKDRNHNPGWIRLPNGDLYTEERTGDRFVLFGCGDPAPATWELGWARLTAR